MLTWLKNMLATEIDPQETLGRRGENAAAKYLRELGYRIITRNFAVELGEIDIIARDGNTLVFVEVKTRADDAIATPEEQVNETKQHQITKVAKLYMSRYGVPRPPARFDVVSILWPQGREPQIKHLIDAFPATF
ncbi:MAG TPA: YraN family protein [Tepidisphaeraceae bacterium]|nr:YraN family protein [Tepidisphaeraceae bacterium]